MHKLYIHFSGDRESTTKQLEKLIGKVSYTEERNWGTVMCWKFENKTALLKALKIVMFRTKMDCYQIILATQ